MGAAHLRGPHCCICGVTDRRGEQRGLTEGGFTALSGTDIMTYMGYAQLIALPARPAGLGGTDMTDYLLVVAGQVLTLFLLMGVGFVLFRRGRLNGIGLSQMTHLLLYVVTPCIIINSLQADWDSALLHSLALGAALLVMSYLIYALLVLLLFRHREAGERAVLRFGSMYGNCGFMGLPLVAEVLGEGALIYAALCVVCFNVSSWVHGVALIGGRQAASVKRALINPGVLSLACGLPLFLLRLRLPSVIGSAVSFLADLNTPLAMVVIGGQMAQADWASTFRQRRLYGAAAVKLLLLPALTALLLLPFHLDPTMYSTLVILAATPTAGLTAMFAQRFERCPGAAAQLVTLSTLLCILTLPLFAALARMLAG